MNSHQKTDRDRYVIPPDEITIVRTEREGDVLAYVWKPSPASLPHDWHFCDRDVCNL